MWMICKKEWLQFFSSLTGYIALIIFLLLTGLFLFVFPNTDLLSFGYASLSNFFSLAPWILLFLIPTITMRSLADEYKAGTFELLKTLPVSSSQIVWGKYFGALLVVALALLPTILYAISIQRLSAIGGIDVGATIGSYIGLFLLGSVFTAIGICASSFTNNTVVAFIAGAFICLLFYTGFEAISKLPLFSIDISYKINLLKKNLRTFYLFRSLFYTAGFTGIALILRNRRSISGLILLVTFLLFVLVFETSLTDSLSNFIGRLDYYIEMMGINYHYHSISRGVVDLRDIVYFAGIIVLFLLITQRNIARR